MVDQFCLKWNNYQASLTNAFKSLLENEDFVDVTLSAGGKTLRAHKVVLSACSSYFKQLLRGISSWQHPVLVMRDVPFVDLYTILEFIYMGEVNVAQSHLTSFLKTAELLQIKGLAENASFQDLENEDSNSGSCSDLTSSSPTSMTSQKAAKRRRISSDTSGHNSKLLNDSLPVHTARGEEEDLQFKEEMNDLEEESNLYVDESGEQDEEMLLSSNQVVAITDSTITPDGNSMGPNHKKCTQCGIVMLKKNFARHMRDMHTEPKPRSLCPLCQKSYKTSDWLKDHIRRGHGYTKELTDKLMASLRTPTKPTNESQDQFDLKEAANKESSAVPALLSFDQKSVSKPNLALIDIQSQPMTILNSLSIVKQEQNIPQT